MSNFCEWKRIIAIIIRFDVDETYIHIYIIENVEEITESTLSRLIDVEIKLCNFMEATTHVIENIVSDTHDIRFYQQEC